MPKTRKSSAHRPSKPVRDLASSQPEAVKPLRAKKKTKAPKQKKLPLATLVTTALDDLMGQ
jgi:hypothetical protein